MLQQHFLTLTQDFMTRETDFQENSDLNPNSTNLSLPGSLPNLSSNRPNSEQKKSRKTDFQLVKSGIFSVIFHILAKRF